MKIVIIYFLIAARRNNWPPLPEKCCFQPCFYQDINVDIPLEFQKIVRLLYYLWMCKSVFRSIIRILRSLIYDILSGQFFCEIGPLWYGTSSGCRWMKQPPEMEGSCKDILCWICSHRHLVRGGPPAWGLTGGAVNMSLMNCCYYCCHQLFSYLCVCFVCFHCFVFLGLCNYQLVAQFIMQINKLIKLTTTTNKSISSSNYNLGLLIYCSSSCMCDGSQYAGRTGIDVQQCRLHNVWPLNLVPCTFHTFFIPVLV